MSARNVSLTKRFFTQRGVIWSGIAFVLLGVGLASSNGLVAAFGLVVLLLLAVCALWGKRNLQACRVTCQSATSCYADTRFPVRITVENPRRFLDAFALQLVISLPGTSRCEVLAPWIAAGSAADVDTLFQLSKRGHTRELPALIESDFPLGLWKHSRAILLENELSIYPKPLIARNLALSGVLRDARPSAGATFGAQDGEIRGLRPWRAGDSLKRIHPAASARSFARGSGLVVAEADPPGFYPRLVTILFHSYASDRAIIRPEMFERALSYVCGTLRTLVSQGTPVSVLADFDGWVEHRCENRQQLSQVLHRLARVQRCAGTELHDLVRAQSLADADATLLLISDMPVSLWQHAVVKRRVASVILATQPQRRTRS